VHPFYITNELFFESEDKIMFQFGSNKHKKLVSVVVILLAALMIVSTLAAALM